MERRCRVNGVAVTAWRVVEGRDRIVRLRRRTGAVSDGLSLLERRD